MHHRLHLLRHAKSLRDEDMDDHARPLNPRGRKASNRIGKTLQARIGRLDLVLCSTALRTRETAELVLAGFKPRPMILYEDALYLATAKALLRRLQQLDEAQGSVMLIGHNPGLHKLALELSKPDAPSYGALSSSKFPTGAWASFAIDAKWSALDRSRQRLVDYVTPKSADQ
jgi:phosphohistidine phosphatase